MNVLDNMVPGQPVEDKLRQLVPPSVSEAGLKRMDSTIEQLARAASPGNQAGSSAAMAKRKGIWRAAAILALLLVPAVLLTARNRLSESAPDNALVASHFADGPEVSGLDNSVPAVAGNYWSPVNDEHGVLLAQMDIRISPGGGFSATLLDVASGRHHSLKGKGSLADLAQAVGDKLGQTAVIARMHRIERGLKRFWRASGHLLDPISPVFPPSAMPVLAGISPPARQSRTRISLALC